jgi:hypothetical protein
MSAQSKPHEFESPFSLRQSAVSRTGLRDLPPGNLDHHASLPSARSVARDAFSLLLGGRRTSIATIALLLLDRPAKLARAWSA